MKQITKAPICFVPYLKSVIWGGNKICSYKAIEQPYEKIGESWEISAVPGFVSVVESGEYRGMTLDELIAQFGAQLVGEEVMKKYGGKFPLLVKLIDANDNLSIQVHPDERLARERHNSQGKTEMWYIIAAEKGAKIYSGLNKEITPLQYESMVADGTFINVVDSYRSAPGSVFYLPPGRVHSIGAGNLLVEIQESSDITYRIFDYNRRDASGNPRQLHTDLAKDAIDYAVAANSKSLITPENKPDAELVACPSFSVRRVIVNAPTQLEFNPASFTIIMCIEGNISLRYGAGLMPLPEGHTVLLPAVMNEITLEGLGTVITAQAR
ncbi:MAG: class I mannose-6-phosphate isomerase [Muribaculum sp.]|nr:class I mannose-6-phosphate isomerase [Muribaculaceae bacterium]MCM1081139.1 class I mannose-6-phosphate isomerase [Muribaculum sp.]